MTTVLLWGDRWWLPRHTLPVPFADLAQAAAMLAAAWPAKGRIIRLIYQPDDFATIPVDCPNGNRGTLMAALAEEHPVVLHPGHVWSYEPILGAGEGFNTLLHYEPRPAFFALVHQLEEHGFRVSSAWPLASWLTALPPDLSSSGAMTLVAMHGDRYCIYRHSPAGVRSVHTGRSPEMLATVAELLRPVFTQSPGEFVLFVTADDAYIDTLNEKLTPAANQVVGLFMLWEALGKDAPLPHRHPAQLLPAVPRVSAAKVVAAASAFCVLAASLSIAVQARAYFAAQAAEAERAEQVVELRPQVARLRENAAEITRSRVLVGEAGSVLPATRLLRELGTLPPTAALSSLRVTAEGFLLSADRAPEGEAAVTAWTTHFGRPELPWHLGPTVPGADGSFQVPGTFTP